MKNRDLQVVSRPIDTLIPYVKNARTHDDAQIAQIAVSISEFGWTNPILVDGENGIIAGHGRVLAARKLGLDAVPVIELANMTEAKKQAYILADNKLAMNSEFDTELLALELGDLRDYGFDIDMIGFDEDEVSKILDLPAQLKQKELDIKPIHKTRILISVNTDELHKIQEIIDSIVALRCAEIDYGGN